MINNKPERIIIWAKTLGRCAYCGKWIPSNGNWVAEHMHPRIQGGKDEYDNLIMSCNSCNNKKGGYTVNQFKIRLIKRYKKEILHAIAGTESCKYLLNSLMTLEECKSFAKEIFSVFDKHINTDSLKFYFEKDNEEVIDEENMD